jgi:hypothetical protein
LVPLDTELSSRNGTSRRFLTTWFWVIALMRTSLGHLHIIAVTISIGETSPDGQVSIYIFTRVHTNQHSDIFVCIYIYTSKSSSYIYIYVYICIIMKYKSSYFYSTISYNKYIYIT